MEKSDYGEESYPKNRYLYNGKELNSDKMTSESLNWYDYGARFYDPQIGRWHIVDPLSKKYESWSTYQYVRNNPIVRIDPNGMEDGWFEDEEKKLRYDKDVHSQQDLNDRNISGTFKGEQVFGHLKDGRGFAGYADGSYGISIQGPTITAKKSEYNASAAYAFCDIFQKSLFNLSGAAIGSAFSEIGIGLRSISSFIADFASQMTFNGGKIKDWNISSSVGSAVFKNPFAQSAFGSAFEVRLMNIQEGDYLQRSIIGQKQLPTFLIETSVGGAFNYTGSQAVQNLGIKSISGKIAAESPLLYLNYIHSSNTVNLIQYKLNK